MNTDFWKDFSFAEPWWLIGLALLPLLAWLQGGRRAAPAIRFSAIAPLRAVGTTKPAGWGGFGRPLLFIALALLIVALARPRLGKTSETIESSGLDIVLTLDVSGSMRSEDFTLNGERATRLDAVKLVAHDFIERRPNDRIGMVIFAASPFIISPTTLDHTWLLQNLDRIRSDMIRQNGTYIAGAIASAASKLDKNKSAKSKIIILLTDGAQNTGEQDPAEAAQAAAKLGIKIYTIGAGADQRQAQQDPFTFMRSAQFSEQDEEALRKIASAGHGLFFRATDTSSLKSIFDQIDKMEKTEIKVKKKIEWNELFPWFIAAGSALLALRAALTLTLWRTVP